MANPANLAIAALATNGSIDRQAAQNIDTNGTVPMPNASPTDRLFIEAANTAAQPLDLTVKAGVNPPALAARDLVVTIPATTGFKLIGPFESGRFLKADGSIDVQFQAASGSPTLAVRVYRLPKQI